jgi:hypothetical protein
MALLRILIVAAMVASSAQAQDASPSQIAISIDEAVGFLAKRVEAAERQVKQLQEQNAALQRELDEAKKK